MKIIDLLDDLPMVLSETELDDLLGLLRPSETISAEDCKSIRWDSDNNSQ